MSYDTSTSTTVHCEGDETDWMEEDYLSLLQVKVWFNAYLSTSLCVASWTDESLEAASLIPQLDPADNPDRVQVLSEDHPQGDALHRSQQYTGEVMLTSEVQVHPDEDTDTCKVSTSCSYECFSLIQIRTMVLSSLVSSMGTSWTDEFLEAAAAIPAAADDGQVDYDARWEWVSLITQLPRPELHQNTRLFRVYKGTVLHIPDALVNFPIGADAWYSCGRTWPTSVTEFPGMRQKCTVQSCED